MKANLNNLSKLETNHGKVVIQVGENGNAIMTLPEVADKMRVSRAWLYKKCKANIIPHLRIGGIIRFRQADLDKWISDHMAEGCLKI